MDCDSPNVSTRSNKRKVLDGLDNSMLSPGVTYASLKRPKPLLGSPPNVSSPTLDNSVNEASLQHDFNETLLDSSEAIVENTLNSIPELENTYERPSSAAAAGFANLTNTSQLDLFLNDSAMEANDASFGVSAPLGNLSTIIEHPSTIKGSFDDSATSTATVIPSQDGPMKGENSPRTPVAVGKLANDDRTPVLAPNGSYPATQEVRTAYTRYSPIAKTRELFDQVVGAGQLNTTMVGEFQDRLDEISFVHHELALNDVTKLKSDLDETKEKLSKERAEVQRLKAQLKERERTEEKAIADYDDMITSLRAIEKKKNAELLKASESLKALKAEKRAEQGENAEQRREKEAENRALAAELNELKAKLAAKEEISQFSAEMKAFIEQKNAQLLAEVKSKENVGNSQQEIVQAVDNLAEVAAGLVSKLEENKTQLHAQTAIIQDLRAMCEKLHQSRVLSNDESEEMKKELEKMVELQKTVDDLTEAKETDEQAKSALKKTNDELTDELERMDDEKSAMFVSIQEARRELLSFKCRYGMITKKAAIKEIGDNKFKPPSCLFTTTQVRQIKQWLAENTEEEASNLTTNKSTVADATTVDQSRIESVTPGRSMRARRCKRSSDTST